MNIQRCANGHFYDTDMFAACPHCKETKLMLGSTPDNVTVEVISEGEAIQAGRDYNKCKVVLKDAHCARVQAKFEAFNDVWYITDLGSTNGTKVNGRRLGNDERAELKHGDLIAFAETETEQYFFISNENPADNEIASGTDHVYDNNSVLFPAEPAIETTTENNDNVFAPPQPQAEQNAYAPQPQFEQNAYAPQPQFEQSAYAPQPQFEQSAYAPQPQFEQNAYAPQPQFEQNAYAPQPQFEHNAYAPQPQFEQNAYAPQPQFEQNAYAPQQQFEQNNDSAAPESNAGENSGTDPFGGNPFGNNNQ